MSSYKVLSVDLAAGTMVIDWGSVILNHYIPTAVRESQELSELEVREHIEAMRPLPAEPVSVAPSLLALVEPAETPTTDSLCGRVDQAADAARHAVAGDALRAVEYERSAAEAVAFKNAGYPSNSVPPMVAAWALNGRTARDAADSILAEAARYNGALVQLRTVRLQAKEQIRALMADGNVEQAQAVADGTVEAIQAAVAGVGNAGA